MPPRVVLVAVVVNIIRQRSNRIKSKLPKIRKSHSVALVAMFRPMKIPSKTRKSLAFGRPCNNDDRPCRPGNQCHRPVERVPTNPIPYLAFFQSFLRIRDNVKGESVDSSRDSC